MYFDGKRHFSKICTREEAALLKAWTLGRDIQAADYDISGYGADILFSWWLDFPNVCALVKFIDSMGGGV